MRKLHAAFYALQLIAAGDNESPWLRRVPESIRRQIQTVCTDMWEAYVAAVREVLPHSTLVIDRFHVAKTFDYERRTGVSTSICDFCSEVVLGDLADRSFWEFHLARSKCGQK